MPDNEDATTLFDPEGGDEAKVTIERSSIEFLRTANYSDMYLSFVRAVKT